jgi:predicted DNA-binding transcriptional regulator YafY
MSALQHRRYSDLAEVIHRKPGITLEEIQEALVTYDHNVSARTLQRDIQHLRNTYKIDVEYDAQLKGYTIPETTEHKNAISGLLRFRASEIQHAFTEKATHPEFSAFVSFEIPIQRADEYMLLRLLEAIHEGVYVAVEYQSFDALAPRRHELEPLLLKEYQHRWYLIGDQLHKRDLMALALDRMHSVHKLSKPCTYRNTHTDALQWYEDVIGISRNDLEGVHDIIIRANIKQAKYMETQPWHISQQVIERNAASVLFQFRLSPNTELERLIMACGAEVEVVYPEFLRVEIAERHREAVRKYGG